MVSGRVVSTADFARESNASSSRSGTPHGAIAVAVPEVAAVEATRRSFRAPARAATAKQARPAVPLATRRRTIVASERAANVQRNPWAGALLERVSVR